MSTPVLPFVLPGFVVEHVHTAGPVLLIEARSSAPEASCPNCHTPTTRVHSRYTRRLRDLPVVEYPVRPRLHVRRFRCPTPTCGRQTSAERLPAFAPVRAQRTVRLTETVRVLGR
jgi:transposase